MEKYNGKLQAIQNELLDAGYCGYANLLSNYLKSSENKTHSIIGFVGGDLVGKSRIINDFIGEKILPTSVIPSMAEITIRYGKKKAYISNDSLIENDNLAEIIEGNESVEIISTNDFLRDNLVVIKEYHGLINKKESINLNTLFRVYECDAIVFVMSAEHLLSESERLFIDNYIRYVGANHILLVVNRIDLLSDEDIENLLEYAGKQIELRFTDVKWVALDKSGQVFESNCDQNDLKSAIFELTENDSVQYEKSKNNILQYIKECLVEETALFEKDKDKDLSEIARENKILTEQKAVEEIYIEEALIDFKQRKNLAIEKIDFHIKEQFEQITSHIIAAFDKSTNKYDWYKNSLEKLWISEVSSVSKTTDEAVNNFILNDVNWLNMVLKTKLNMKPVTFEIASSEIKSNRKIVPYGKYKKFIPIGTGGIVVVGYCLFRIIGVAIGLSGGVLSYALLGIKDLAQIDEMRNEIISRIRDILIMTREITQKDIEIIYNDLVTEFEHESKQIISSKYDFGENNTSHFDKRISALKKLIKLIEEEL